MAVSSFVSTAFSRSSTPALACMCSPGYICSSTVVDPQREGSIKRSKLLCRWPHHRALGDLHHKRKEIFDLEGAAPTAFRVLESKRGDKGFWADRPSPCDLVDV